MPFLQGLFPFCKGQKFSCFRLPQNYSSDHQKTKKTMEYIGLGLQLMAVGMVTVFAILLIVINGSKLLIEIVNHIAPEKAVTPKKQMAAQTNAAILTETSTAIDAVTMEILQQAVAQITMGKGRIANATKV